MGLDTAVAAVRSAGAANVRIRGTARHGWVQLVIYRLKAVGIYVLLPSNYTDGNHGDN